MNEMRRNLLHWRSGGKIWLEEHLHFSTPEKRIIISTVALVEAELDSLAGEYLPKHVTSEARRLFEAERSRKSVHLEIQVLALRAQVELLEKQIEFWKEERRK